MDYSPVPRPSRETRVWAAEVGVEGCSLSTLASGSQTEPLLRAERGPASQAPEDGGPGSP